MKWKGLTATDVVVLIGVAVLLTGTLTPALNGSRQTAIRLVCEANAMIGDEAKRNELYRQAEKILIEDVALMPIYHGVFNVLVNPKLKGPALEPNKAGVVTFRGFRFNASEGTVYRTK